MGGHNMVRRSLIALFALIALFFAPAPAVALSCTMTEIVTGLCNVGGGTDGTDVNLWVDGHTPGGSNGGSTGPDCNETADGRCVGVSPPKTADKPESVHDLASFRPHRPAQSSEPSGWSIAGLPTNFLTAVRRHTVRGELSGHAAEVRFTPVRFTRTFGDGSHQSTTERGARWSTPWSATRTSHVYRDTGVYVVELTAIYVADYRYLGLPWSRLTGTVSRSAPAIELQVFSADTVLVDRACTAGGVGC